MSLLNYIYIDVHEKVRDLKQEVEDLQMSIENEDNIAVYKQMKNEIWRNSHNIQLGHKIIDLIEKDNKNGLAYYLPKFYSNY